MQVLHNIENFGIEDTMILYPKHKNDVYENLKLGKEGNIVKLQLRHLDLNFDKEYKSYISEIKKRMEQIHDKNKS